MNIDCCQIPEQSSYKAFVTGGTGFIGINLIELLVEQGWDVTALYRDSSNLGWIKQFPVQLKQGEVTDLISIERAIPSDTEVVFHLAGSTNMWSKRNDLQTEVNLDGTRNVVKASVKKGVTTFIHTSSVAAWGNVSGNITEETPQKGGTSWVNYESSKWAGEREALKGTNYGMKVIILNPTHVTGPYDINNWGRLFFALSNKNLPGIPKGNASVTHVREVAKAHLSAVEGGRNGERYILSGDNCTFQKFIHEIARVSDIDDLPPRLPTFLLKSAAHLSALVANITGEPPNLTPELVYLMTRSGTNYSSRKAEDELNYRVLPMEQSVHDCYEWLQKEDYL